MSSKLLNYLEIDGFYNLEHSFNNKLKDKTDRNQTFLYLLISKSYSKLNQPFYNNTSADWRGSDLSSALIQI